MCPQGVHAPVSPSLRGLDLRLCSIDGSMLIERCFCLEPLTSHYDHEKQLECMKTNVGPHSVH